MGYIIKHQWTKRIANTSIRLSDNTSATQLIQQLRGRNATLLIEKSNGSEMPYTGRIIGIEQQKHDQGLRHFITMRLSDGMVRVFPFDSLRGINIQDEQSKEDLSYFLDTSMSEDNRRAVTVRMSEGEHDLAVYYVAPSPTWRVSYRLVAESDEDGTTGTALLQGWGLFDNRLEEDLEDVRVTLVAGQPISFIYDLYASQIPQRPIVRDEARTIQQPIEYQSTTVSTDRTIPNAEIPDWLSSSFPDSTETLDLSEQTYVYNAPAERFIHRDVMAQGTRVSTETKSTGETFQYTVTAPVTVKRGESALVPIISETVHYQRELLYNKTKLVHHPVASFRFENQSGLTFERGPVTIVEDNDYRGEAIITFTGDKKNIHLPYAVELGVYITEHDDMTRHVRGLAIEGEFLKHQVYMIRTSTYEIDNSTDADKIVTIETSINALFDLFDTPLPDVETTEERRWKVACPTQNITTFTINERRIIWEDSIIKGMAYSTLNQYMENRYLDQTMLNELRELFHVMQSIGNIKRQIDKLQSERKQTVGNQDEFRRNMQSLGNTGEEGTLRQRMITLFSQSQDRLEEIDAEIIDLKLQIENTEKQVDAMIAELGEKYPADDSQK